MGPVRASTSKQQYKDSFSVEHKTSRKHADAKRSLSARDASAADIPGVQKLKSALRQTRRLLAKDYLAADVRVETERRLRSLEADLEAAERKRKERALAVRYHKVKFFERRKVLRKIKKVKKELEEGGMPPKEAETQLENAIFELRAQLNYILNYPKLEKYISLFPPSKDEDEQNPDLGNNVQPPQSETDARREHLLSTIKQRMVTGELSWEPELGVEGGAKTSASAIRSERTESVKLRKGAESRAAILTRAKGRSEMPRSREMSVKSTADHMKDDGFFDTGSDSASSSASDPDTTTEET